MIKWIQSLVSECPNLLAVSFLFWLREGDFGEQGSGGGWGSGHFPSLYSGLLPPLQLSPPLTPPTSSLRSPQPAEWVGVLFQALYPGDCGSRRLCIWGSGELPVSQKRKLEFPPKYVLRNEEAGAVVTSLESLGGVGARGSTGPATTFTTV